MLRWCTLAVGVCLIASTYTQADTIGSRPCATCSVVDAAGFSSGISHPVFAPNFEPVTQELAASSSTASPESGQLLELQAVSQEGTASSAGEAEEAGGFRPLVIAGVASELMTSDLQDSSNTFYIAGTGTEDQAPAELAELPAERPGPSPQSSPSSAPGPSSLMLLGTCALGVAGALRRIALEPREIPEEAAKEARPTA